MIEAVRQKVEGQKLMNILLRNSRKSNALIRAGMIHLLSGVLPLYIVNEYPKAGGTWVGQMLGRALDVPFPRNRLPTPRSSIMHGHYLNSWGMKNVTIVWRDGRDVMVSWYHQCLMPHERNKLQVERDRKNLPFRNYEDVRQNLPAFIEYAFTDQSYPGFSWTDFVRYWYPRRDVAHTFYEDLRRDTAPELQRLVLELTGRKLNHERASEIVDEFSFERQTGRRTGEENKKSFLRKGVVGDWKEHFSREAKEVFDRYAGEELIMLGYEQSREWVK